MHDPLQPQRVALVRLSHLGDVVHALPVFHALRERYPAAELAWVVQPLFAPLVEGLEGLGRVLLFDRDGGWRAWRRLRGELRDFAPELVVDAQGNWKSATATWLSGARRRVGLAREDWREPLAHWLVREHAMPAKGPHAMDRMQALVDHIGGTRTALRIDPGLTDVERAHGRNALAERLASSWRAERPPLLLHLSAAEDVRGWPLASWQALLDLLASDGEQALVLAGPGEQAIGRALFERCGHLPGIHFWLDQKGLRPLAALFAAAAERGGRLVACDSGPQHLAVACGLAVTSLAGPQDAARTGPWAGADAPHRTLRAAQQPSCAPCLERRCSHAEGPVCMAGISAADVHADLNLDTLRSR